MNLNSNKSSDFIDNVSNLINTNLNRRKVFGKELLNGLKFLLECSLVLPIEISSYFKDQYKK